MNDFQMYEEGRKEAEAKQCDIHVVSKSVTCYTCNCTTGKQPEGDNYCNMCDHYF